MARSRTIKPSFFTNDELADCSIAARMFFIGLWTLADKEGRLEDRPKRLKAELFPYDDFDCDKLAMELHGKKFIVRYAVEGQRYIQIVNFKKHQNPHPKEQGSIIPELSENPPEPAEICDAVELHGRPCKEHDMPGLLSFPSLPSSPSIPSKVNTKPRERASLSDLSVDDIADWLSAKRAKGRYTDIDEFELLEKFKDYCLAKKPKYADYVAAFRNAFDWSNAPKKGQANGNRKISQRERLAQQFSEKLQQIRMEAEAEGEPFESSDGDLQRTEVLW